MKKLLIIDDEFIFRQGLRYMMNWENCGYTIVGEASNGQEGLELCNELQPDLILCDVVMPILNGVEFVKKVRSQNGPPVVMLSNFDEYDKVRKAFHYGAADYILKSQVSKELILTCLDRILSFHSNSKPKETEKTFSVLIRQVLDGYATPPFVELTSYIDNRLPTGEYMLLYIESPQPDFHSEQHFQEEMYQIGQTLPLCSAYTTLNHAISLISYPQNNKEEIIQSLLQNLKHHIRNTSCALSLPFHDISKIKEVTEEMHEVSKYSILYENQLCFYQPEIENKQNLVEAFPSEEYYSYISLRHIQKACNCLLEYLNSLKNTTIMNPYSFRKFTEHIIYSSIRELRKSSTEPKTFNLIELKLFKQIDNALTFTQMYDAIAGAFGELASICVAPKQEDFIIMELKKYIEENYSQQITLYDVASHLHMNYSYLSAYISQNTGKHFSELLNDTRIRHAKELLNSSSHNISFISENIGYTDQSYFGKMFKKTVGITPLQYRNQATNKKQE